MLDNKKYDFYVASLQLILGQLLCFAKSISFKINLEYYHNKSVCF